MGESLPEDSVLDNEVDITQATNGPSNCFASILYNRRHLMLGVNLTILQLLSDNYCRNSGVSAQAHERKRMNIGLP